MIRNSSVLFRADGCKKIGMGHLYRTNLLASMFKQRFLFDAVLLSKNFYETKKFVAINKLETIFMEYSLSVLSETKEIKYIIDDINPKIVVLDVLDNDQNDIYIESLRGSNNDRYLIAITDDSNKRVIDADLVINGNPNQLYKNYDGEKGRYLLGPQYFIMDSRYEIAKAGKPNGKINNIFITFGGSDHNNLIFRILNILNNINKKMGYVFKVTAVVSKASGYLPALKEFISELSTEVILHVDVESLIPFFIQADISITAGGNTLFERIATRLPGSTICQLKRQNEIANCFESLGVNVNFGYYKDVSDDDLQNKILAFINNHQEHVNQYKRAPDIITGKGLSLLKKELDFILEV